MRRYGIVSLIVLAFSLPAWGTDYYVRTDGNDSNTGTANTSGGAWLTVGKCATTLTAGDRCMIQPGTYRVTAEVNTTNAGTKSNDVMASCNCTNDSTTITCSATVTGVAAGDFVQCDTGYGFFWTEVSAVDGTTITLTEGYRGPNAVADTLDKAAMIQYIGASGTTPTDRDTVILTTAQPDPGVTWSLEAGTSCVYSYAKADAAASGTVWADPDGVRENVAWSTWDTYYQNKNGLDPYWKISASACPCNRGTLVAALDDVPGSWNEDASKVYVATYDCVNPSTISLEVDDIVQYVATLEVDQPYVIVRNMTIEAVGSEPPTNVTEQRALEITATNNVLAQNIRCHGGKCGLFGFNLTDVRLENLRSLHGLKISGDCDTSGCNQNNSGVYFYNVEARGGGTNTVKTNDYGGASAADPIIFDRFWVHRGWTFLTSVECGQPDNWDCSTVPGSYDSDGGIHGLYVSSVTTPVQDVKNVLIQNCISEQTGDGLGLFMRSNASNVKIRNCTLQDGEVIAHGNSNANAGGIEIYNTVFHFDDIPTSSRIRYYGGSLGAAFVSNYNAWMLDAGSTNFPQATSVYRAYTGTPVNFTLDEAKSSLGEEANSIIVCASGCSSAQGLTVYNDGTNNTKFTDTSVSDGDPSDYTPLAGNRVIDAGLNSECPEEDYYGNPRDDGSCDIGAVEYQGGGGGGSTGTIIRGATVKGGTVK